MICRNARCGVRDCTRVAAGQKHPARARPTDGAEEMRSRGIIRVDLADRQDEGSDGATRTLPRPGPIHWKPILQATAMQFNISFPPLHTAEGYDFLWSYLLEIKDDKRTVAIDPTRTDFLLYCLRNYPVSSAQLMQDLYVCYKLKEKRNGFFVEFGATDGVSINNTVLLERNFGWKGILAEPFPHWHAALDRNRRCAIDHRCVWSETGREIEFLATHGAPEFATVSTFAESDHHREIRAKNSSTIRVRTVSLNDLLRANEAPADLDYLSVDTEGSEYEILRSLDFARYQPRIITVEHNFNEAQRTLIKDLLASHGYRREFEGFSKWDDWFCPAGS
jgi:FkbM family methyltransferase